MSEHPGLTIRHLIDVPEAAPVLARWFIEAWAPHYGPDGPGDAEADLAACRVRDAPPLCLVALPRMDDYRLGNGPAYPLGTVALTAHSIGTELAPGPWLSALLVNPGRRGRGIGRALVDALVAEATRLAFPALYTSAEADGDAMRRRGWSPVGICQSSNGPITVYRLPLPTSAHTASHGH